MSTETTLLVERYEVGDSIGSGGMSDVYLGHDTKLDRKVAIKVLRSSLAQDPAFRARFQQEALASSKMTHPGIVRVFDAGEDTFGNSASPQPFIVMEWVDGIMLKDLIQRQGHLPLEQSLDITDQLLSALQYSHRAGIVHRDIKPSNVMITQDGRAKLMDFGIARAVSDSSATVEQTSTVLGTAQYFSPEQARGETVDARTDLYSLGLVLFEMITGKTPFTGDSAVAIAYQHVNEEPPSPSSLNPDVPEPIDRLVLKAIAKPKEFRFQTAGEFRKGVTAAAQGQRIALPEAELSISELIEEDANAAEIFRDISSGRNELSGTQKRPPATWLWAGVIAVTVLLVALVYWVVNLTPPKIELVDTVSVPNVIGATWESARDVLTESSLKPVQYLEVSEDTPEGQVLRTVPLADQVVSKDQIVQVYVSSGAKKIAVPNVVNRTVEAAQQQIESLGLVVGSITQENSPTIAAGTVMAADPPAGSEVSAGTVVNLVTSTGKVLLPNLKDQPLSTALNELSKLGLQQRSEGDPNCPLVSGSGNPVINQSVAPGLINQRTTVTLYFCSGQAD